MIVGVRGPLAAKAYKPGRERESFSIFSERGFPKYLNIKAVSVSIYIGILDWIWVIEYRYYLVKSMRRNDRAVGGEVVSCRQSAY